MAGISIGTGMAGMRMTVPRGRPSDIASTGESLRRGPDELKRDVYGTYSKVLFP